MTTETMIAPVLPAASELAIRFGRSNNVRAVGSIAEAVGIWEAFRDENSLGASASPKVTVVDLRKFKTVATISYNGRAWGPDGNEIVIPEGGGK